MSNVDIQKSLERLGLSSNEARIYLALLKIGSSKAGRISKETQINRTTTYDALKGLLEKGLVNYVVKANRKWFEAENPKMLIDFIKEKERDVEDFLPDLEKIFKSPKERHNVTLYYGYGGMRSAFQDIIREGKPNCVMDSEGQFTQRMPYFSRYFIKQIEKKKIKIRHLVREGVDMQTSKTTEVKYLHNKKSSDAVINIYGNKVAIIIWTEPPEAVIIKNKTVADSFRDYFEMIWKNVK